MIMMIVTGGTANNVMILLCCATPLPRPLTWMLSPVAVGLQLQIETILF